MQIYRIGWGLERYLVHTWPILVDCYSPEVSTCLSTSISHSSSIPFLSPSVLPSLIALFCFLLSLDLLDQPSA